MPNNFAQLINRFFILCAKPKFLPDNSCNTTCMCKDYIEFHCARLFEFWPIYNRAKSLAVMLNNINALIESQSVTCMPFDRWKSKKDERVKKGTSINDRRHILLWSESLYYYFYVRILYEYVCVCVQIY